MSTDPVGGNPPSPVPDLVGGEQRFLSVVKQFFVVPMLIALTAVAIFVGVRAMTDEDADPVQLVQELRLQRGTARWQVAFDLNARLTGDAEARRDPRLVPEVMQSFRELQASQDPDDARTRAYLVTILGTLRDPAAVAIVAPAMHDRDGATQVAAIQAAGSLGDPAVLPELLQFARSDDAGLRKSAVFALGLFSPRRREAEKRAPLDAALAAQAREALFAAYRSPVADVRWNAALALCRWGEPEAAGELRSMLDRAQVEKEIVGGENAPSAALADEVMVNAMKGVLELRDAAFRPLLERIRVSDRSAEVRRAAGTALEALGS